MTPINLNVFDRLNEMFLLAAESLKASAQKIAGIYCNFAPTELVRAAGAVPVGLCGKKQAPIAAAETILPPNLCPLIKSSFGYAHTNTCPYFEAANFLVGETTCDGKKKMFEIMGRMKPLYLMHLPYNISPAQVDFWTAELRRFGAFLEQQTGHKITAKALCYEIGLHNRIRRQLERVAMFAASPVVPLSGMDLLRVMEAKTFVIDQEAFLVDLQQLCRTLEEHQAAGRTVCASDAPRILLTGCPVGKGAEKVLRLIEDGGGIVVCQENCTVTKYFEGLVDETLEPYRALAERYIRIPCSCMTPNTGRFELIGRLAQQFRVNGMVDLTWQCCHTYNVEAHTLREYSENTLNLPYLHLETDYAEHDTEQLKTRVEAFLEMLA